MGNAAAPETDIALTVQAVSKSYGNTKVRLRKAHKQPVKALEQVTLELKPGFYALLGPNGAGKSTLLNILSASMRPDKGKVLCNGTSIWKLDNRYRKILGYMPQQQSLYPGFTGNRFLHYMCALKGISWNQAEEVQRAAKLVNLSGELEKRLDAYSGGMKQRILAASALIGNPRIIIMDEPTAGLDPKERVRLRESVAALANDNIVLLATHVVSDVETTATQVIIMKGGRIEAQGTVSELVTQYAPGRRLEDVYIQIFGEDE